MSDVSNYAAVGAFHIKFNLPNAHTADTRPRHVAADVAEFRMGFLYEELKELDAGYQACDLAKIADALVDLVYVALGTAQLHGLPWQELFDEVQRANMTKQRATSVEESKAGTGRGHMMDVIKPPGWTPPNIEGVLQRFGYVKPEESEV